MDPAERIIGHVWWDGPTKATLLADHSWRVSTDEVDPADAARILLEYYEGWDEHPSMYYGQQILPDLARWKDGRHTFHMPRRPAPDEIN